MLTTERSSLPALSAADGLANATADFMLLAGRILMGWIFVRSGYGKIFDIAGYAATFPGRGLPLWAAWIAVPAEFFGGIALILGFATRYVVGIIAVFMIVATFSSHAYWTFADAAVRRAQETNFWKNVAMFGGLCFLFVAGPGRLSVDRWLARR